MVTKKVIKNSKQFFTGTYLGRIWSPKVKGPCVVTVRDGDIYDITSKHAPTVRDICEMEDSLAYVKSIVGERVGSWSEICQANTDDNDQYHILAPCDLQAVKACGVTFASSMVERVIEEQAAGDPQKAKSIRDLIGGIIGDSLKNIEAGSRDAEKVKEALIKENLWSQYLEVGIGPDAEVFSKSQTLSSVGHGAEIGLHPISKWNNPEPEVVLVVSSKAKVVGACLGNDVNLRDIEGRSALLLSKAKDNNASCSIGPMIRLFDDEFTMDTIRSEQIDLLVEGEDGFVLKGQSNMSEISRDPLDLVSQIIGPHHQYPDGFMLFLGTLFAPTQDRDVEGEGFTHKVGDKVAISSKHLGLISNTVRLSTKCAPWTFGVSHLMKNLAERQLL